MVEGGSTGAGWLMTCCVMLDSARRGERRGESRAGRGECAFRLVGGGGSPVDADDERRLIIAVRNEVAPTLAVLVSL